MPAFQDYEIAWTVEDVGRCPQLGIPEHKMRVIAPTPLPVSTADIGAAVLASETFLRNAVDQAIASLIADGTLQGILTGSKFPAVPVK